MITYEFKPSSFKESQELFDNYFKALSGVYDNFLENHILQSELYCITIHNQSIGYFAIFNDTMLTQFYIEKVAMRFSKQIFQDVLERYKIKNAFVPTCDELFLSLSLDFHKKVDLQAYFFEDNKEYIDPIKAADYNKEQLREASIQDFQMIRELSEDFFDNLEESLKEGEIYILEQDDEVLGFGIIEKCYIFKEYLGIGMFTVAKHRQKGVGRTIIMHLKAICYEQGYTPLAGCWYYNYNSKITLESCGYSTKTRLLNIIF